MKYTCYGYKALDEQPPGTYRVFLSQLYGYILPHQDKLMKINPEAEMQLNLKYEYILFIKEINAQMKNIMHKLVTLQTLK
ncbi:hypothetical protein B7492_16955 [Bacillus mycoides]|uniref:Uncharacterized protein n=1 Tax=Bacillus mycoides TaxID=1405 RepID=J8IWB2_BACMY|nr:hypothetical protein [Bacillus mycoides]ARJ22786.1 hypothetical protein B7492_16955 [Bacillus mycoides]EJR41886.1 hypothetical protein III_02313 [Bacillus mycoides]QWH07122.1 hypothetical protein EXW49_15585 [Bacillus mycoides]